MVFVTNNELLSKAKERGYAVGAFNTNNLEITLSIVEAAVAERAPVILAVSPGAMEYAGVAYLSAIAEVASESADVPVSLHLDHGFSSVMIDGSKLPFEENVGLTCQAVELAREGRFDRG